LQHGCRGLKLRRKGFEPEIDPIDRFDKEREATQRESRSDERAKPGNAYFSARPAIYITNNNNQICLERGQ
jgi:hypothetical protein